MLKLLRRFFTAVGIIYTTVLTLILGWAAVKRRKIEKAKRVDVRQQVGIGVRYIQRVYGR